jgi:hypothetical protein
MRIYDFTSRKREMGRVVFALTLDKKRMTERISIGRADDVRRRLEYGEDGYDIYFDETRPLGSLLINFESDTNGDWNRYGMLLRESYGKENILPITGAARWKMVAPASEFFHDKYKDGEPSAMFAAIRTWEDYLNLHNKKQASDTLTGRLHMMYKPFIVYADYRPWQKEAADALSVALRDGESNVELWYPVKKRSLETVVTSASFLPIIFYYTHKIKEWDFVFQQCKVCDRYFLARSRHYELCSDECRKSKAATTRKEFEERAKDDTPGKYLDNAYQYWYNRWRKLKSGINANLDIAAAFKVKLTAYQEEAKKRKAQVVRGELRLVDFSSWLLQQQNEADRLFEELIQKRHDD